MCAPCSATLRYANAWRNVSLLHYDGETGLHYNWHRDYNPLTGRYSQADPLGLSAGWNLYAYAGNNPAMAIDPDGKWFFLALRVGLPYLGRLAAAAGIRLQGPLLATAEMIAGGPIGMGGLMGGAGLGASALYKTVSQYGNQTLSYAGKICPITTKNFFKNTKYTDKVIGQMKQGDLHAFPESVTTLAEAGKVSKITGGDGKIRDLLQIPGEYRGKNGVFEFIREADGSINHRLFKPNINK